MNRAPAATVAGTKAADIRGRSIRGGFCVMIELELIQVHMAQKPVLRIEVGARALRVRSVSGWVRARGKVSL